MPKDTFNNLSDDKKRKIFNAAVQEFATRRFSEASINQIVKTAGISRGSFYQYFNDKEDIYLYMLTEIGKEKLEIIGRAEVLKPDADFFEAYLHMAKVALEWVKTKPEYNRIGMLMEMDDSEFIAKLRAISIEGFAKLKGMIERDKQRGLIKPEIDSDLIVDMIYTLMMHFLKEYYRAGSDEDMLKRASDIIKIIKEGIAIV
ncbi:MAG: TetR/AcrR family transcriptional regulator [Bacillota bacterium]|nr:TetR/AcrR family transcriptional regulator [Bacillota bacterium]